MPDTSTTTTPPAQRVARRDRAAHAFTLAYARRGGDMATVGPWLLGYLESCVEGGMSTTEIADTARGIADAWKATCEEIAAELDANIAAATNQPRGDVVSRRGLHEWSAYSAWAGATGPITGPLRIDGLVGNAPTWRVDAGDCPIFDALVAEYGPPGMLVGPGRELLTGEVVPA